MASPVHPSSFLVLGLPLETNLSALNELLLQYTTCYVSIPHVFDLKSQWMFTWNCELFIDGIGGMLG